MWGEKKNRAGLIPFFLVLALVMATTILIGQVLGRFYLANILKAPSADVAQRPLASRGSIASDNPQREQILSRQTAAARLGQSQKMKVLRLTKEQYYTIVLAESAEREEALQLGQRLGEQGLPVIVTAQAPYRVLLGYVNNEAKLATLAERIKIDEKAGRVSGETLNRVAFKFPADDTFAAETLAPYLGRISVCLAKGLMLYKNITVADEEMIALRPKYAVLAGELQKLAAEGEKIAVASQNESIKRLAGLCGKWGQVLGELGQEWGDDRLLKSQQQALALLEEYHRFLSASN
jgi:hypothetical protein